MGICGSWGLTRLASPMPVWSYQGPLKSGEDMSCCYRVGPAQWVYAPCHSGIGLLDGPEQAWRSLREGPPIKR